MRCNVYDFLLAFARVATANDVFCPVSEVWPRVGENHANFSQPAL